MNHRRKCKANTIELKENTRVSLWPQNTQRHKKHKPWKKKKRLHQMYKILFETHPKGNKKKKPQRKYSQYTYQSTCMPNDKENAYNSVIF